MTYLEFDRQVRQQIADSMGVPPHLLTGAPVVSETPQGALRDQWADWIGMMESKGYIKPTKS